MALVLVLLVTLDLTLSGCVRLPERGPVRSVAAEPGADGETLVDYTPAGPRRGMAPLPLVDNFLTAMTATPLNTYVARQYLTAASGRSWVPERGTIAYGGQQLVRRGRDRVDLVLRDVVELDGRGTWRGDPTHGRGRTFRLGVVRESGQWRISHPPDRLLVPRPHFDSQYQQHLLYFFDPTAQALVPEPVYVPRGRQAPTLLVSALLAGPEPRLRSTERTFLPRGTTLDGISVPVSRDGTAEVPLSDQVLDVDDTQLNLVFAQLAWTLGQVEGVRRLRVTVDGTPVQLPNTRQEVGVDSWSEFDPSVAWASSALFGLRGGRAETFNGSREERVGGPFGGLRLGLRSLAVDLLGQHMSGVSGDGTRVLEADRDGVPGRRPTRRDVRTVLTGGDDLLRPAYDLYGQLWVVDRRPSGARVSVVRDGTVRSLGVPGVTGRDVRRFALARDGTRIAVQLRRAGRDHVLVARVRRDDRGRVIGVGRPTALARDEDGPVHGLAWRTPSSLAVLVDPSSRESQVLVLKVDGSSRDTDLTTDPDVFRGRATELVTAPARDTPVLLDTRPGKLYALSRNGQWSPSPVEPGLRSPTFVG